jgi:arylformamidase
MPIYHDITVPLVPGTPLWPGDGGLQVNTVGSIANGDEANVSRVCFSTHSATHVDAPFHFIQDGKKLWEIPIDTLVGPCWVAEFPEQNSIDESDLEAIVPPGVERLLLKTTNSAHWENKRPDFDEDYAHITCAAAEWCVRRGIKLIGIDYLSVESFRNYSSEGPGVHLALLGNDIIILETINLTGIASGAYQLVCLPLLVGNGDGAPARCVLVEG